jgi:hypothetical protein
VGWGWVDDGGVGDTSWDMHRQERSTTTQRSVSMSEPAGWTGWGYRSEPLFFFPPSEEEQQEWGGDRTHDKCGTVQGLLSLVISSDLSFRVQRQYAGTC